MWPRSPLQRELGIEVKAKAKARSAVLGQAGAVAQVAPYQDRTPNAETIEAIRQVEAGEDLIEYENMDEFMKDYEEFKRSETEGG